MMLTQPCVDCPFRVNDRGIRYLGTETATEIVLFEKFDCHTLDNCSPCKGHELTRESMGVDTKMMRIRRRLGLFRASPPQLLSTCFVDAAGFIEAQGET